jgi:hypothetical protein
MLSSSRVALSTLLLLPSLAAARPGNFQRYPVGAQECARGGAGIATSNEVWFNPAGLGAATRVGLSASVSAYGVTNEKASGAVNFGSGVSGDISNSNIDVIPASIGYVKPFKGSGSFRHGIGFSVVLPDYDEFDGSLEIPAQLVDLDVKIRHLSLSRTFWIMPGWGGCWFYGKLCVGASPAFAVHQEKANSLSSIDVATDMGRFASTQGRTMNVLSGSIAGHLGLKASIADLVHLGATVRTPTQSVVSTGSVLTIRSQLDTTSAMGQSFVDRLEVNNPRLEYRLPWQFGVGIAVAMPRIFSVEAELRLTTPLEPYTMMAGPNGETTMQPVERGQTVQDPARAFVVEQRMEMNSTLNFAVGAEVYLKESLAVAGGVFTDFSALEDAQILRYGIDRLSRIGVSAGVGLIGDSTSTWVSAVYIFGSGQMSGIGPDFGPALATLESSSIMLILGSTTNL